MVPASLLPSAEVVNIKSLQTLDLLIPRISVKFRSERNIHSKSKPLDLCVFAMCEHFQRSSTTVADDGNSLRGYPLGYLPNKACVTSQSECVALTISIATLGYKRQWDRSNLTDLKRSPDGDPPFSNSACLSFTFRFLNTSRCNIVKNCSANLCVLLVFREAATKYGDGVRHV